MKQIPLTQGKFALVDDEDYDFLMQWKWYLKGKGYVGRSVYLGKIDGKYKSSCLYIHQEILPSSEGFETDHRDGNPLNNQRYNLRICSHRKNAMNRGSDKNSTSKYKGVCWNKQKKKWKVRIKAGEINKHIGYFTIDQEIEAAQAYDIAAKELFGEFARLNFN